ncbi:MAG: LysE family translocator, partial [Pseudorhizobium sp.]
MPIENWLAFVAASAVLLAIPGPTILLVISYALSHGRSAASATVAGTALGDFTAMTASMLGLGALLAASATLFTALKWIGAAYLIYLG